MGAESKIEWTHHTFNPWIGCEKISPGCKHCYASVGTSARVSASRGLPLWGPGSSRQITTVSNWRKPIAWDKAAAIAGERHRVFCASLADVFEDRPDLVVPRARLAMLIAETPHLDWLLLTKRPENADRLWRAAFGLSLLSPEKQAAARPWLPNIWLGTTCEDQQRADERLPELLAVPARVRFVSYEPALEAVDFSSYLIADLAPPPDKLLVDRIDWVIVGGESGPGARAFEVEWARSTIEQCKAAGVAVFCKQLGARPRVSDLTHVRAPARLLEDASGYGLRLGDAKGGDWSEWPEDLRVRQWPAGAPS